MDFRTYHRSFVAASVLLTLFAFGGSGSTTSLAGNLPVQNIPAAFASDERFFLAANRANGSGTVSISSAGAYIFIPDTSNSMISSLASPSDRVSDIIQIAWADETTKSINFSPVAGSAATSLIKQRIFLDMTLLRLILGITQL